jgi:DnaJ-class molecular chaperone
VNRHLSRRAETLAGIAHERQRATDRLRSFKRSFAPFPEAYDRPATCATCGGTAEVFRDALSLREFTISKMCQGCQDSVFNEPQETKGA